MRVLRTLSLLVLAASAVCAFAASAASAQTGIDFTTGVPLPLGAMTNAVNTTNVVFAGINGTTVTCANSELDGTVTANPPFTEQLDNVSFTNCANSVGGACTVVARGLPWSPAAGGILANGMPGAWMLTIGMAAGDYIDISCGWPMPCSYQGAAVGPGPLTNSMTGAFTNPPALNDLSFVNAPLRAIASPTGVACPGNPTFSTMYTIRVGTLPGAGNPIALV